MKEFNRLLAKGQNERQEKRSATSCVCFDIVSSPERLNNVKSPQITCAGRGAPPAISSEDLDESETLRRALGTVQLLLEKRSGNYKLTLDEAADEGLMKNKSNESKLATKLEERRRGETDKDRRKKSGGEAKNLRR